jgi:hypothetical protein
MQPASGGPGEEGEPEVRFHSRSLTECADALSRQPSNGLHR